MTNDKLTLGPDGIIGILLAAAAAVLCATIDHFIEEEDNDD